ncbi:uncharacterized protein LOC143265283 [Megachile rotundata]|uniref:uncharacterized protein LOC143265283 n=1 Tax=Megachile rotundata TaxID=143995 RepID=UPI003FCFCC7F
MHLPLIAILSLVISISQVSSEVNSYEYSDQYPWPLVYTIYPFYNSETFLEVWRTAKTVDISTDIVTAAPNDQEQTVLYTNDVHNNNTNLNFQNNLPYYVNEIKNANEGQTSKNRQRLSNYRNRHKDTNVQNE